MSALGKVYTLEEAAEKLRMTPRKICKIARATGACSVFGKDYLFSENDIVEIWNAKRCPSNLPAVQVQKSGTSGALYAGKAYSNLLEHARKKKQRPSV